MRKLIAERRKNAFQSQPKGAEPVWTCQSAWQQHCIDSRIPHSWMPPYYSCHAFPDCGKTAGSRIFTGQWEQSFKSITPEVSLFFRLPPVRIYTVLSYVSQKSISQNPFMFWLCFWVGQQRNAWFLQLALSNLYFPAPPTIAHGLVLIRHPLHHNSSWFCFPD